MGQSAVFSDRFLWPRQFVGGWKQNGENVGMWNNIELEEGVHCTVWVGGAALVVVVLGTESNKNYSSPPSHVEIKLSDSGVRRIFRINSSHHQLLPNFQPNFTPFHFELQSQFSFTHKTFTFEENLPFSGFPHRQCHAPILKES